MQDGHHICTQTAYNARGWLQLWEVQRYYNGRPRQRPRTLNMLKYPHFSTEVLCAPAAIASSSVPLNLWLSSSGRDSMSQSNKDCACSPTQLPRYPHCAPAAIASSSFFLRNKLWVSTYCDTMPSEVHTRCTCSHIHTFPAKFTAHLLHLPLLALF
jgi:hypothetical protein